MELAGERRIAAPRRAVWAALNDPAVWRVCLPGCDGLEGVGGDRMVGSGRVALGPVSVGFGGSVTLTEIDAPSGYRFLAEGQAGGAGAVTADGRVVLTADADGTLLRYCIDIGLGGMLARLGAHAVEAAVRRGADGFFARFAEAARARDVSEAVADVVSAGDAVPPRGVAGWAVGPLVLPVMGWMGVGLAARCMVLAWGGLARSASGRGRSDCIGSAGPLP